ncbi:MAG: hypothetical protein ACFWTZ_01775 [Burkholderia sp.]
MVTHQLENYARQSLFDALAGLFIRPEDDSALPRWNKALTAAAGLASEYGLDAAPYEKAAKAEQPSAEDLSREYAKLFLGVGEITLPLCESAWTSEKHLLSQKAQLDVRKAYSDAGVACSGFMGLPDDHIGIELGFMAVQILREDLRAASDFFSEHPARWLPALAKALSEHPDARFYRTVAPVLTALCEEEKFLRHTARR